MKNKNGFFIKENNNLLCNGIFGSKPNTPLMNKWRTDMISKLDLIKILVLGQTFLCLQKSNVIVLIILASLRLIGWLSKRVRGICQDCSS